MNTREMLFAISGILAMEGHGEAAAIAYRRFEAYMRGDAPENIPYSEEQAVLAADAERRLAQRVETMFKIPFNKALVTVPVEVGCEDTACEKCIFQALPDMCNEATCTTKAGVQYVYKLVDYERPV